MILTPRYTEAEGRQECPNCGLRAGVRIPLDNLTPDGGVPTGNFLFVCINCNVMQRFDTAPETEGGVL